MPLNNNTPVVPIKGKPVEPIRPAIVGMLKHGSYTKGGGTKEYKNALKRAAEDLD